MARVAARILAAALLITLVACSPSPDGGTVKSASAEQTVATRPLRIAVLTLYHESNVFLPNETTLQDFVFPGSPVEGEEVFTLQDEMGGFAKVAREFGGVELVGIESPREPKTGMGSGWVQRAAFDQIVGRMQEQLSKKGPFDGVYMALHGAMSVRGIDRTEAEIARRVRETVGPKAVIAATFDPHGNEDQEFFKWANLAFAYKYYPHYDANLQGERAARMLIRTIRKDFNPVVAVRKPPILTPDVNQWTGVSPWMDFVERALTWEARYPDTFVNLFYGFPWADVPDVGMCVEVITNGDAQRANEIADDLAAFAWQHRVEMMSVTKISSLQQAMDKLSALKGPQQRPVVLADYSDRSGNAVWILGEVVKRDLANVYFATIRDAQALDALVTSHAKTGDDVDLNVGGYWDASSGKPVRIRGKLVYMGPGIGKPHETWAVIRFGRNNILVLSPFLEQIIQPKLLEYAGLEPKDFEVFVLKTRVHFRRGFMDTGFAKTALLVEPPGNLLGTVHLEALPYERVKLKDYFPWGDPRWP